jgi:hypothetical protein
MKTIIGLVFGILWLVALTSSIAVPIAIIWAAYHFIMHYKG